MKCPHCNNSRNIEIDMHSDGYADDLLECSFCGTMWLATIDGITVIKKVA